MNLPRLFHRFFRPMLLLAALALVLMPWIAFSADAAPAPDSSADALGPILNLLAPVIADLKGRSGWLEQALLVLACLRVAFKPVMTLLEQRAKGTSEEQPLANFEHGPIYKTISFILDFGGSIKLPVINKNLNQAPSGVAQNTMKTLLCMAALVALIVGSTGCKTGADGKRTIDVAKVDNIKTLADPIAAGAIRRALVRSPEHAAVIAPYLNSVAGVFCTMSLSNEFSPTFLIDQANQLTDPALEKIGDGFALDIKEGVIAGYKLLYGDRLHAEIPPDQWLHKVCEFFCESITQGLVDAGYPGGVKKSAAGYRRDLERRLRMANASESWEPLLQY